MELCQYCECGLFRTFRIEAIQIPIVYNKYGDHDPDGLLYVLADDADRIREGALRCFHQDIPQPFKEVKPLVIRANLGEKVQVKFRHSLIWALSILVQGLEYDVNTSDGASVGFNEDSTTEREIMYT